MSGPVDFEVGDDTAPADAEDDLLLEPGRPRRWPWVLGAVALLGIGLVTVLRPQAAAHRAAASATASISPLALPVPSVRGSVVPLVRVPEGNRHARQPAGCPDDAECYLQPGALPPATTAALRARFAGARITSASSLLANRTGRFDPDLVARSLHARAGAVKIVVTVRKPRHGDADSFVDRDHGADLDRSATHAGLAFTVTVEVVRPRTRPAPGRADRATLAGLAADPRLVVPL